MLPTPAPSWGLALEGVCGCLTGPLPFLPGGAIVPMRGLGPRAVFVSDGKHPDHGLQPHERAAGGTVGHGECCRDLV